jgi:quercetin dioxygenase-like cupin family protein
MRVLDLTDLPRRPVTDFGSVGFAVSPVGRGAETHHVVLALEPGGVIGRHDAVGRQLLAVLAGDAVVSGADGVPVPLVVGQAALWEPGESHETRSAGGMTALVVEGDLEVP